MSLANHGVLQKRRQVPSAQQCLRGCRSSARYLRLLPARPSDVHVKKRAGADSRCHRFLTGRSAIVAKRAWKPLNGNASYEGMRTKDLY
jgi:hypothetical protein